MTKERDQFSGLENAISCALGVLLAAMACLIISGHLILAGWLGMGTAVVTLALKLFL